MKDIRMSRAELDQIAIIDSIIKGQITQREAALVLSLSTRQVRRKLMRYLKEGSPGFAHKGRGKRSNRKISEEKRAQILELLNAKYPKLGPTLASEKLSENHAIAVDHETLRRMMIEEGLWQVHQRKFISHVWRERKMCFGELIQVDGSYHKWFNNQYSTLIAFIDDATGIVELLFANHETTESLSAITQTYLKKYGRPKAVYADRGKVYKVNNAKYYDKERYTQYERMLRELDIEMIHAYSPQAKGRVERLFKTLQDRLVKELELRQIKTMVEANEFLRSIYIDLHNLKFKKEARNSIDLHQSIDGHDLNSIFCIKEDRILNNDRTITYRDRCFLIKKEQPIQLYRKCAITVSTYFDGTIALTVNGKKLDYREIIKMPMVKKKETLKARINTAYKPPHNHPWRNPGQIWDTSKELKRRHF